MLKNTIQKIRKNKIKAVGIMGGGISSSFANSFATKILPLIDFKSIINWAVKDQVYGDNAISEVEV